MKYRQSMMAIGLALVISGCQACGGAGASGALQDAAVGVDGPVDVDTDADAAEVSGSSDGGAETGDVDAVDSADSATAIVPKECQQGQPMPGEPCTKLGEVRCTNFGINQPPISPYIACSRPNTVVCAADQSTAQQSWQLAPCPGNTGTCTWHRPQYCSPGLSGEKCAPIGILPEVPPQPGSLEDMFSQGIEQCGGVFAGKKGAACRGRAIYACTTVDKMDPEIRTKMFSALGKCAAGLQDVPFRLPVEVCPNDEIYCKINYGTASTPPTVMPVYLTCVLDSVTKQPKCAKTCADMGIKTVD